MDTELIILVGVLVALCSIIWGVLGYFYRDDVESGNARGIPPPPPPPPVSGAERVFPAPKLKLSRPVISNAPPVLSTPRSAEGAGAALLVTITTQPAVRVLPSGFALHGVNVLCRGRVPWRTSEGYRLVFQVVDFEDQTEGPLQCAIPDFGGALLGMVRYVPDAEPPLPGELADWTELAFLPTSLFKGPRSGLRTLSLRCGVMPVGGDPAKCVQVGMTTFKANLELPGFLDDDLDLMILVSSRIVELALACAAADGNTDIREQKAIQDWIEQSSCMVARSGADSEARFRSALMKVMSSPARATFTLESAVFALHSYAEGKRMEALALCVRVIASDGVLHEKEMRLVEKLADLLQIDRSIMQTLFDKQFANSGIVVSPDNLEAIVRIDPSWDKDKIRRHLAEQFMKWNSRAPAAKTVEDQARIRAMLDAIAKLKHKYA
jgi:uncharacterized tellurite resistance protein B-like protein